MYHRITNVTKEQYVEPGMYVTPASFRKHMDLLRKHFRVISLEELCLNVNKENLKPLCAITFDDGWKDFYTNAYPVLKEYGYPSTVFLPTNYIGSKRIFWTDKIADVLLSGEFKSSCLDNVSDNQIKDQLLRSHTKANIHALINFLKKYPEDEIELFIEKIGKGINKRNTEPLFMNWDQVKELYQSRIVEFGSHTANHLILTKENALAVINELQTSMNDLRRRNLVSSRFVPFCYPNGNNSKEIVKMLRESGYSCAVTTKRGWNDKKIDRYRLKRVGLHQDVSFSKTLALVRMVAKT